MSKSIQFALNGAQAEANCRPDTTVLEWLRDEALLRGSKEGCAEGDCGACSVLVKHSNGKVHSATNACIMLMGQLEGASLFTVEGLAALGQDGHTIQQKMALNGSSQCGFCTPGIVSALAGMLESNTQPKETDIHDALAGNLCRCTGYRPIVEAAQSAALELQKSDDKGLPNGPKQIIKSEVEGGDCQFHLPQKLDELLDLKAKYPKAVLLAGGTDLSLAVAHARARWSQAILTKNVTDLQNIARTKTHIEFGGAVTWQQALPEIESLWPSFATLVRRFGSVQIRAMGTIAGTSAQQVLLETAPPASWPWEPNSILQAFGEPAP